MFYSDIISLLNMTCNKLTNFICDQIEVYPYVAGRIVFKSNPCALNRLIVHVRSLCRCFNNDRKIMKNETLKLIKT